VSTALVSDLVNQAERSWYIAGLACAQIEAERIVEGVAFSLLENLLLERSRALSPASFLHQPRRPTVLSSINYARSVSPLQPMSNAYQTPFACQRASACRPCSKHRSLPVVDARRSRSGDPKHVLDKTSGRCLLADIQTRGNSKGPLELIPSYPSSRNRGAAITDLAQYHFQSSK